MSRTSITLPDAVFDRLDAQKREDESWPEFGERVAELLEAQDGDVSAESNAVPDDILTEENIPDIVAEVERSVERTLSEASRR